MIPGQELSQPSYQLYENTKFSHKTLFILSLIMLYTGILYVSTMTSQVGWDIIRSDNRYWDRKWECITLICSIGFI